MTSRDYLKIEQVRTWLLGSSLAASEQFFSESFFQICFSNFLPGYMFHVQFLPCGLVVLLFCFPYDDWSCWLFALKISNCSPLKLIFSEGPSFFVRSVCNDGALKLRLHVIALPASLAMSWPAEIKWKLNRSGIDFLVLVLQSSHSYILKASFNFASVNFFLATCFMFSFFPGVLWFFYSVFHTMTGVFGFLVWKFQIVLR